MINSIGNDDILFQRYLWSIAVRGILIVLRTSLVHEAFFSQINKIVSSDRTGDKLLKQVCLHRVISIRAPFSMIIHALISLVFRFYDF